MTTLAEYVRHAELYGDYMVVETAMDELPTSEVLNLVDALADMSDGRVKTSLSHTTRTQLAHELLGEGAPVSEVARRLGLTRQAVQYIAKKGAQTPQEPFDCQKTDDPDSDVGDDYFLAHRLYMSRIHNPPPPSKGTWRERVYGGRR